MKRSKRKKIAKEILYAIVDSIDELSEENALDISLTAWAAFLKSQSEKEKGLTIADCRLATKAIIGNVQISRDPGRPAPGKKTWADLLKEPEHAEKIETTIAAEVQKPRDLAALVEAMSRRKLLNNEAGNSADVIRASARVIGESRAGSAKNLRENRQRYTTKETGKITYFLGLLANLGL